MYMVKKVGMRKGDTLVEVMLAVGIFSMVAIAVVSVVSGSTSSAQTALEATLAREEIDAQAEAIRFIHDSYLADRNGEDNEYSDIWSNIVGNAAQGIADSYPPASCDDLYSGDNSIFGQNAFVINTHKLGKGKANEVYVKADNGNTFKQASTYPRLVFKGGGSLAEEGTGDTLNSAEGIYVVAVKDSGDTNIVTNNNYVESVSAYYDFYIRTCWYGTGDREASTISTVIRLYDPAITENLGE